MKKRILSIAASISCVVLAEAAPNVLLITADDLNYNSLGAYGSKAENISPNLDRLAKEGVRFEHAHVTIAVCQPSRSVWMTGRYPINSGGEAFHKLTKPNVPILPDVLRESGYEVGILGKYGHSTPYKEFKWDMEFDMFDLGAGRSPKKYAEKAKSFVEKAKKDGKPFFLMANSHDPHRPFYGNDPEKWYRESGLKSGAEKPSKIYHPEQVRVPNFLPDIPNVRLEVAEYFASVRRLDDTVGSLLKVIEDAGETENTLVLFLSDNGMALPFAKTNVYLNSTKTPLIVRWPAKIKAGWVEEKQMVSGIDMAPTIYEAAGVRAPEGMDGKSFLGILEGKDEALRDRVFTQFYQTSARRDFQMRAVQSQKYGFIYNAWADGEQVFKNESMFGRTFKAMKEAGVTNTKIQQRVELFSKRTPLEFYDFEKDPDALNNLIDAPEYQETIQAYKKELEQWMINNVDPELDEYRLKAQLSAISE